MDHRRGKRVDVQLDVLLFRQGLPVMVGKTRNVSRAGAFVETDYRPEPGNLYVEVAFIPSTETKKGIYPVKGLIMHSMRNGIGLIFDDFDPESRLPAQMRAVGQPEPDRERLL